MYFFSNEYTVSLVFRMVNQKPGIKTSYPVAFLLGEKVSFNNSVAMHVRMLLKIIQYLQISLSIKVHNDRSVSETAPRSAWWGFSSHLQGGYTG